MVFSNADKQQHGQSAQKGLKSILQNCEDMDYLKSFIKNYKIGKKGYNSSDQFKAHFLIEFNNGSRWILHTTTSMRTDRAKGVQWDVFNLKEIDSKITKAYLIYPDGIEENERAEFLRIKEAYANNNEYSVIDDVLSQDQINNLIEEYAIHNKSVGQIKDIQGNNFENRISSILNYEENLSKWKNNVKTIEGMHFSMFKTIIDCFKLDKHNVLKIDATSDKKVIGRLPSGGNPKTDVLVKVIHNDASSTNYTISCKRSSNKSVSVHQYTADTFAGVLDSENHELCRWLNLFQKYGNIRDFGEDNCKKLTQYISPYIMQLSLWVLGGYGGSGDPETQCASYILTYDNNDNSASIHPIIEYCTQLIESESSGHFGTPFSWTYASRNRGKNIQLKCKIIK